MPIELLCPLCENRVRVPDAAAGAVARCPECRGQIRVSAGGRNRATAPRDWSFLVLAAAVTLLAAGAAVGALALAGRVPGFAPGPAGGADPIPPRPYVRLAAGPAPAPEDADPFRPADPGAVRTIQELDRLADALPPLPQDADRQKAVRAARARWHSATMDGAFDRFGRTDAPWAAQARAALRARAAELAAAGMSGALLAPWDPSEEALAAATGAGCDDPLVLYYHRKVQLRSGGAAAADARREGPRVAALLCESRYPDVRKLYAAHNVLVSLAAGGARGPTAEVRAWDARYGALLGAVAADPDPVTQEHVIELARLREEYRLSTGGTREQAHEEFAARLGRAPEPTALAVKGAFLVRHGWDARGRGYANTVSEEGFRLLGERLEAAEVALTAAHEGAPDQPHAATQMLTVCLGRGHDRGTMERWFGRALRADPDNVNACHIKLEYLHPKWYGSDDEYLGFAWQCVRTRDATGLVPYAPVASILANNPVPPALTPGAAVRLQPYYSHPRIWAVLDVALTVLRRDHPDRVWVRGLHARVACLAGRYAVAARELVAVGDDYRGGGFGSESELTFYRTWAREARLPATP